MNNAQLVRVMGPRPENSCHLVIHFIFVSAHPGYGRDYISLAHPVAGRRSWECITRLSIQIDKRLILLCPVVVCYVICLLKDTYLITYILVNSGWVYSVLVMSILHGLRDTSTILSGGSFQAADQQLETVSDSWNVNLHIGGSGVSLDVMQTAKPYSRASSYNGYSNRLRLLRQGEISRVNRMSVLPRTVITGTLEGLCAITLRISFIVCFIPVQVRHIQGPYL